jgi:type IV secretory pathway TrbD component
LNLHTDLSFVTLVTQASLVVQAVLLLALPEPTAPRPTTGFLQQVREIARECLRYEPDLFLLYCGNNDVVGPFGPGTVFQSGTPPMWFIRLQLRLSRLRLCQELKGLASRLAPGRDAAQQWRGMETFLNRRVAGDDPRMETVYAHFRANLRAIVQAAGRRAVPLVICTVPVNLEACAPFASEHRRDWTETDEHRWRVAYALGTNAETQAAWVVAEMQYAQAAALDPGFAEVDFRRARCLAALGRLDESRRAFSALQERVKGVSPVVFPKNADDISA